MGGTCTWRLHLTVWLQQHKARHRVHVVCQHLHVLEAESRCLTPAERCSFSGNRRTMRVAHQEGKRLTSGAHVLSSCALMGVT